MFLEQVESSHHYTVRENEYVDNLINSHVQIIKNIVLQSNKDALAIVLIGGYSRGEGSVAIEGDKITPLGDYDFVIITRRPHLGLDGAMLAHLARGFDIGHIELSEYWVGLLPFVPKKIFWYELKFGSKVIYGNERILGAIPLKGAEGIDLADGFALLFNRLDGLLRCFDPQFLVDAPQKRIERTLVFEAVKAILACGDSLLVLRRRYHYSYRKRMDILRDLGSEYFPDLMQINPCFLKDFEEATSFKLSPDFASVKDPIGLWFISKKYLLTTIVYYWRVWIGAADNLALPESLLSRSRFQLRDYLTYNFLSGRKAKPIKAIFRLSNSFSDIVRASLFLLALSMTKEEIVPRLLDRSVELISSIARLNRKTLGSLSLQEKWKFVRNMVDLAWSSSTRQ